MYKNELLEAIRQSGIKVDNRMSKGELQEIYDGLHVHRTKEADIDVMEPEEEEIKKPEKTKEKEPEEKEPEEKEPEEKEPEEKEPEEPEKKTEPSDFDELLGKIKDAEAPPKAEPIKKPLIEKTKKKRKRGESSSDSFRIEGYVLLLITDTVFPFTFAFINNLLDKKIKIDATDLQLAEKDFNKLEPLADQAADYMSINLNPIAGFLLISTFMYANNLIIVRMQKSNQ